MIHTNGNRMFWINPPHFWEWFQEHLETFRHPSRLTWKECKYWDKELYDNLTSSTSAILFPDLAVDEENNQGRLIITAHGKREYFMEAELIIDAAPEIEGWEFVALYPPVTDIDSIRHNYPSVTTTPAHIFFSPLQLVPVNGRYNLELYMDEKGPQDWELKGAATQMMYSLLGEKTGAIYVRKVSVSSLAAVSPDLRQSLLPMTQLPAYIQPDHRSRMVVNPGGNIRLAG